MDVLNKIKPGLDETRRGHAVESQKEFPVFYESELIGNLIPDLIVDDKVIVDPKVVAAFNEAHVAQMAGCLTITGFELELLLNFKSARLE
jgi:GxxExxY protein